MDNGDTPSPAGAAAADSVRAANRSIAAFPFEALSQEELGTFTEGMHDALLTRLASISRFTVIPRTAVRQYRDTQLTTREVADSLGVQWILARCRGPSLR